MARQRRNSGDEIEVRHGIGYHLLLWTLFPALGGIAGWVASMLPGWVERLAWFPFLSGPLELLDQVTGVVGTIVLIGIGAVIGAVVALTGYDDVVAVRLRADEVEIDRIGSSAAAVVVPRSEIAAAFADGKELVLTGSTGAVLARESTEHRAERLAAAFREAGYPWQDADPYADAWVRWVEDAAGLPDGAAAYFAARQRALDAGEREECDELRRELARLGVMVRDERKRQYWRLVPLLGQ